MPIAEVEFAGGMKFVGHSESGHSITIDSAPEVGGAKSRGASHGINVNCFGRLYRNRCGIDS